ncbi:nucleotide-diphospho-sugar transferase [Tothia fuscella]|uniref:glycogenin glucosyltransferase n=1 Tax=Tothia fuscella TaxID=1048955 RepID=A0A9P4U184_9PEZI|nr:nucleotide-diphospho-sugar transferase [Tothia fuscella]
MAVSGEDVYFTLVMNDQYLPGAAVLAHSLRDGGTKKKLAALITLETISADAITELKALFDYVIPVDRIANPNPANLHLMSRADLLYSFTKIALWRQTQFRKIVYIDSDVVALRAPDELFDVPASFAAAPDVGWPDAFNSGVMVISPNMGDYWALQTLAASGDSFDGADQGLLNQYYEHKDWHRLSFTYNCTPSAEYQWEPAYRFHKSNIKMVHFIGKNKPWTKGRQAMGGSGVYSELLARWWAVYDRHLKNPIPRYTPGKQSASSTMAIQKQVFGEPTEIDYGSPRIVLHEPTPDNPPTAIEQPFTEPGEVAENLMEGITEPTPTIEQRRFSAPQMEWDATRSAPPSESKPEAVHFPTHTYTFSDDTKPYQPPASYPEPPKDMYYEIPSEKPQPSQRPKAIFPWEERAEENIPSRVFAEDSPLRSLPTSVQSSRTATESPSMYPQPDDSIEPFAPQSNAWDNVASIDRYVRAVMDAQTRRTKAQEAGHELLSPIPGGRRESLILTDFPTSDDRPSLPVTPAPIRRPSFWGDERDEAGALPAAEGVPDQAEWNPTQQLENLRRTSLVEFEHLKLPSSASRKLSNRDMPEHAVDPTNIAASVLPPNKDATEEGKTPDTGLSTVLEEEGSLDELSPTSTAFSNATITAELDGSATRGGKVMFSEPDFAPADAPSEFLRRSPGSFSAETAREDNTLSPTER